MVISKSKKHNKGKGLWLEGAASVAKNEGQKDSKNSALFICHQICLEKRSKW